MRYVMRIAEFSESSNLWTQIALSGMPGSTPLWVSVLFTINGFEFEVQLKNECFLASPQRIAWNTNLTTYDGVQLFQLRFRRSRAKTSWHLVCFDLQKQNNVDNCLVHILRWFVSHLETGVSERWESMFLQYL